MDNVASFERPRSGKISNLKSQISNLKSQISNLKSLSLFAFALTLLALSGCAGFERTQSDDFVDEDGYFVHVDYGRREKDHVFMVVSPGNGKEVEFRSKLMVRVVLPNGERLTAYQTLNTVRIGTMYMTGDGKWRYLTNGLMCRIYRRTDDGQDYLRVYEGNLTKGEDAK